MEKEGNSKKSDKANSDSKVKVPEPRTPVWSGKRSEGEKGTQNVSDPLDSDSSSKGKHDPKKLQRPEELNTEKTFIEERKKKEQEQKLESERRLEEQKQSEEKKQKENLSNPRKEDFWNYGNEFVRKGKNIHDQKSSTDSYTIKESYTEIILGYDTSNLDITFSIDIRGNKYPLTPATWTSNNLNFKSSIKLLTCSVPKSSYYRTEFKILLKGKEDFIDKRDRIVLPDNADCYFILDINLKENSSWYSWNKGIEPPGKALESFELVYLYIFYILSERKYTRIPLLLNQVTKIGLHNNLTTHKKTAFYTRLDLFISDLQILEDEGMLFSILKIIGELNLSTDSKLYSLDAISARLADILNQQRNRDFKNDKKSILMCLFYLVTTESFEILLNMIQAIPNPIIDEWIDDLVNKLISSSVNTHPDASRILKNRIYNIENPEKQSNCLKKLCKIIFDIEEFIEIISRIYKIDIKKKTYYYSFSSIKQNILMDIDTFYKKIVNNKPQKILELIRVVEKLEENEIKLIFYEPHLQTIVEKFFNIRENIKEENIELISELLKNSSNEILLRNFKKKDLIDKMIDKFKFVTVFEKILNSNFEEANKYLEEYVTTTLKRFGNNSIIQIENEFIKIKDVEIQNKILIQTMDIIENYLNRRYEDFFSLAVSIENCTSKVIKSEYINKIVKFSARDRVYIGQNLSKLKYLFSDKRDAYVYTELFKMLTSLYDVDKLKKNDERFKFLENPSKDDAWFYVLNNHQLINKKLIDFLCVCLIEIIKDLNSGSLTLGEVNTLKSQNPIKREAFISYANKVIQVKPEEAKGLNTDFQNLIQKNIESFKLVSHKKEIIKAYIENFIKSAKDYDIISGSILKFCEDFFSIKLHPFSFPPEMQKFESIATEIELVIDSKIFLKYVEVEKNKPDYTSDEIIVITRQAFQKLTTEITQLFNNFYQFRAARLEEIIQKIPYVKEELDTLRKLIPTSDENIELINSIIFFLTKKFNFEQFCASILNLQQTIGFSDPNILDLCQNFISLCVKQKKTVICGVYLESSKKIYDIIIIGNREEKQASAIIAITNILNETPDLISLVLTRIKNEDLDNIKESVNDYDEVLVTAQQIIDFQEVWNYINKLNKISSYSKLIDALMNFEINLCANFVSKIKYCNSILSQIEQLHLEVNLKEKAKKKQIIDIFTQSSSTFFKQKSKSYDLELKFYIGQSKTLSKLNLMSLLELKDRAALINNTAGENDIDLKKVEIFINLVYCLSEIIEKINYLARSGYPDIKLPERPLECINGDFSEISNYRNDIFELSETWKKDLNHFYLTDIWLTYLHGNQFWKLEGYFKDPKSNKASQAKNYLLYMRKKDKIVNLEIIKESSVHDRLNRLGSVVNSLENFDPIILIQKQLDSLKFNKKIYHEKNQILYLETPSVLQGILTIFIQSKYNFPHSSQILYCKNSTPPMEIKSFIYRCFQNREKQLYVLVNCEKLTYETQQEFIKCFQSLFDQSNSEKFSNEEFRLGLICSSPKSQVVEYFRYQKNLTFFRIKEINYLSNDQIDKIIKIVDKTSKVITSKGAGFGKSKKVENKANMENKRLFVFPITGEVSLSTLTKRLCKINFSGPSILLIKINFNNNPDLINEILINLSLFKTIVSENKIFIIPESAELYIEIANSFNDSIYKELNYLEYLNKEKINEFNLNELIVPNTLISTSNYIANYIKIYQNQTIKSVEISYDRQENIERLSKNEICSFLEYAIRETGGSIKNYISLEIFLKVFENLLKRFEMSIFSCSFIEMFKADMKANGLAAQCNEMDLLRINLFYSMLLSTKEFTTKSIDNVAKNQEGASRNEVSKEEAELSNANVCNLTWESSNHFVVIFDKDGFPGFIYRDASKVPDNIRKIIYILKNCTVDGNALAANIANKNYQIDDYSKMNSSDLILKLNSFTRRDLVPILVGDPYVVTPDNYLKMNLIYVRAEARVPIVIMGETGVGKTSLLRFFAEKVLEQNLVIFSIHAGLSSDQIIFTMKEHINTANQDSNRKLWVFFDEFNTNENIGLLCEIMIERTMNSEPMPENLIFAAACNPYKIKSRNLSVDDNVGIKKKVKNYSNSNKLLHMVKPLPDSIIQYVWDFGSLTPNDFLRYITNMLLQTQSVHKDLFANLIIHAHERIKLKEDSSSVSLRDITRFIRLYNWFKDSRRKRKAMKTTELYEQNIKDFKLEIKCIVNDEELVAGVLAYFHCYFLRISSEHERLLFLEEVSARSQNLLDSKKIQNILLTEQNDYFARMELHQGTALNKALRENVFAIIPCVYEKIPIFICGKPGCSKSLAISLIFSNLKGRHSKDPYYQSLSELIPISYQGSESCTSEGILGVFQKAEKFLETKDKVLLPVIVFDEIGLAEISKHNPLKVLHNLLELENAKVGFVAISNWRLDASKMNRVLYLARPEPDDKELEMTALSIYKSHNKDNTNRSIIEALSKSYYRLKQEYKGTNYEDFYGLRDFYNLIKQVSFRIQDIRDDLEITSIVKNCIERNFGGLPTAAKILGREFSVQSKSESIYEQMIDNSAIELINQNLKDENARYLMIISDQEVGSYILEKNLKDSLNNYKFMVGSTLKSDIEHEDYAFRCLSNIILDLEKGNSIILSNNEQIYSSLYDLFNQNFSIQHDRKYCRIALGAFFNPRCFVNNNFRAIIFLDSDEEVISRTDAPFLNRFEKHRLDIEDFLSEQEKEIVKKLDSWIESITKVAYLSRKNKYFPTYSENSLKLLVSTYSSPERSLDDVNSILNNCKLDLISAAPIDILVLAELSELENAEKEFIKTSWRKLHEYQFYKYIENIIESKFTNKSIILTYQNDPITKIFNSDLNNNKIYRKKFTTFASEKDFNSEMKLFIKSDSMTLCLFELDYTLEFEHLPFLKYNLDNFAEEYNNHSEVQKHFCIVLSISRISDYKKSIPLFRGWKVIMMDQLITEQDEVSMQKGQKFEISDDMLRLNTRELIMQSKIFNFTENICSLTESALLKFKPRNLSDPKHYNEYIFFILGHIRSEDKLIGTFEKKIKTYFENVADDRLGDWRKQVFLDKDISLQSRDLYSAILNCINKELEKSFIQVIYYLEKNQVFQSYFFKYKEEEETEILRTIWLENFESFSIVNTQTHLQSLDSSNVVEKYNFTLRLPFSYIENVRLNKCYEEYEKTPNKIQAKQTFIENLTKITVLKEHMKEIGDHPRIQKIYLKDIIRMFLNKNKIDLASTNLIVTILKNIYRNNEIFQAKVLKFLDKQGVWISLIYCCKIAENLHKTSREIFDEPNIFKYLKKIIQKSQITLEEKKIQSDNQTDEESSNNEESDKESQEKSDDSEDSANDENEEYYNTKFKELIKLILDEVSKFLLQSETLIENLELENYLSLLKNFDSLAFSFQKIEDIELKYLDSIEFSTKFIKFAISLRLSKQDVLKTFSLFLNPDKLLTFDKEAESKIIKFIDSKLSVEEDEAFKFKIFYLNKLLINDSSYLRKIVEDIETTNIWKVSKSFFDVVVMALGIIDYIIQFDFYTNDKKTSKLELQPNEYYENVNQILTEIGIESRFGILLCDSIQNSLIYDFDDNYKNSRYAYYNLLYYFPKYFDENSDPIMKIICLAEIKISLDIYATDICEGYEKEEEEEEDESFNKLISDFILNNGPKSNTFQLYCVKLIQQKKKFEYSSLITFKKNSKIGWLRLIDIDDDSKKLNLYPYIPKYSLEYSEILEKVKIISVEKETNQILKDFINKPNMLVPIGLAFMNEIFTSHLLTDEPNTNNYTYWFKKNETILKKSFGVEMTILLKNFIANFPKNNKLRLQPGMSSDAVHMILVKCYILILILDSRNRTSPLTSIFFNLNGELHKDIDQIIKSTFIPANYPDSRSREVRFKIVEFNQIKGTKTYKCSKNCDYVYFIENCGMANNNPLHKNICPLDRAPLGGTGYNLIARDGHCELNDSQALTHLNNCLHRYANEAKPGYQIYKISDLKEDLYLSSLKPISFNLLNAILKSCLLMIIELETIDIPSRISNIFEFCDDFTPAEIAKNKSNNCKDFLQEHIDKHMEKVISVLTSLLCQDPIAWIYNAISLLPDLIQQNKYECKLPSNRIEFEGDFENKIINANIQDISGVVQNYKSSLIKTKKISKENLIKESEIDEECYPQYRLLRIRNAPQEKNIVDIFNNKISESKRNSDYFLVKIMFENKEKIELLKSLYPIIIFTSHLLQDYNHTIDRTTARYTPISDCFSQNDPKIREMFNNFCEAWERLPSDELQYECHILKKFEINEETPLSIFLIDNKEIGGGMYMAAAITYLSNIQNQILKNILNQINFMTEKEESLLDNNKYPPQTITKESILDYPIASPKELAKYYINHSEYGKGTDVIYDFDKLQNSIFEDLYKKKFINIEKLDFIQYQFELLICKGEDSNTITEIRKRVPQKSMQIKDLRKFEGFIDDLKTKYKLKFPEELSKIYNSMNYVLYYLKSSGELGEVLICDYCARLTSNTKKISSHLSDQNSPIARTELKYILEIYSLIEINYFPEFSRSVLKDDFKKNDQKELIKKIINEIHLDTQNKYPKPEDMRNSVLRLILRISAAELEMTQPISYYIEREDLWDEKVIDQEISNFYKKLDLKKVSISNSYTLYVCFNEFIDSLRPPEVIKNKDKFEEQKYVDESKRKKKLSSLKAPTRKDLKNAARH